MNRTQKSFLQIPANVVSDTFAYREKVAKYLRGETSPIAFKAQRVPMGIYGQRASGKYMVRIRIGAGLALPYQLERIAELSKNYGNSAVHVTTRQDIQLHEINIEDTPEIVESLLEVGFSPRGGGGNTIRNVTACPRSGVCPHENFTVAPHAIATAEYMLQHKSSYNLPRKYKIVFSGCPRDCAFASTADLGFFAHVRNGMQGFSAYAGGGLGSSPKTGIKIEDFVTLNEVLLVAESVKQLFDAYGDRSNKHRARLRYVLDRLGRDEFIRLYNYYKEQLRTEGLPGHVPEPRKIDFVRTQSKPSVVPEKTPLHPSTHCIRSEKLGGYYTVKIRLKQGDITAENLLQVAEVSDKLAQGIVRTTQLQDLLITSVPEENLKTAVDILQKHGLDLTGRNWEIVNCTGAATCKLGLCLSRGLSEAIAESLNGTQVSTAHTQQIIRVSGCPNSCANHHFANLGFQGRARRINGRSMPYYDVFAGGKIHEGKTELAEKVGSLPAKRVPGFVREYLLNDHRAKKQVAELTSGHARLPDDIPEDFYYDFGAVEPFSLAGRGPGECGAGVMDVIKFDIDEAKNAVEIMQPDSESVYNAVVSAARALLIIFGLEPGKDREVFAAFTEHLIKPGWVKPGTRKLLDSAQDWKMKDVASISHLRPQVKRLVKRIEELFLSLDANLKFRASPIKQMPNDQGRETKGHVVDLRGVACPLNFVKAKLELEKIEIGDMLELLLDQGEAAQNAPASLAEQGQKILDVEKVDDHYRVKVLREK